MSSQRCGLSFNNCAGKIKSQSCTFRMFNGFCRTIEAIKDMGQIIRFNAGSFVADTDNDLFGPYASTNFDFTLRCIFEGVGNQIDDHLFDTCFIAENDWEILREICHNRMLIGLCAEFLCNPLGQDRQGNITAIEV